MRFMILVKANKDSEAGVLPDEKALTAMGKFNEELAKAGVMLAGEGLQEELIAGFWIWQVKSKDEAIAWLKRAPFDDGFEVEIRQVFEAEDFGPALTPEAREREERVRARAAKKR